MKPTWESGDVQLYLGDCLEVLPTLEDGSVDAVVTDPPYGVDFDYGNDYDDSMAAYQGVLSGVFSAERIVGDSGFVAVYQPAKHARYWPGWFDRQWKPIAMCRNFVQAGRGDIVPATDYVLWWKIGNNIKARDWQDFFARDWFVCSTAPATRDPLSRQHPCPRPVDGVIYLVRCFCPPGGTVLDSFMGSGTTGVACVKTGRKFVGIEIDPGYFEIAVKRIMEAQIQPWLEGLDAR